MKKLLFFGLMMCLAAMAWGQMEYRQLSDVNHQTGETVRYKLYPTEDIWTYLKLDTQDGTITIVRYPIKEASTEVYLGRPNESSSKTAKIGRYELYPTSNIWRFILIDQIDGDVYQVQWNVERENWGIIRVPYSTQ